MTVGPIAYFTTHYPAVSHTFIQREILALRSTGVEIDTFSIRRPPEQDPTSQHDKAEMSRTFYLLPLRPLSFLVALLREGLGHPRAFLRRFLFAFRLDAYNGRSRLAGFFYFLEAIYLAHQLRKRAIRHVHVHFEMAGATVAMIACHANEVSYSLTIHSSESLAAPERYGLRQKIARASAVCCISKLGRRSIARFVPLRDRRKMHLVRCGLESEQYPKRRIHEQGRVKLRLLNVGRQVALKAQDVLVAAVAKISDCVECCVLVGDGPKNEYLKALADELGITDRVVFAGAVDQDHISAFYLHADVFVLTSLDEGVPVVLMEAMAHQIPVVATDVGGVGELVKDGVTGLLVPPGSADAVAQAVRRLSSDPQLRQRLASEGKRVVERRFDIRRSAWILTRIFERVFAIGNKERPTS